MSRGRGKQMKRDHLVGEVICNKAPSNHWYSGKEVKSSWTGTLIYIYIFRIYMTKKEFRFGSRGIAAIGWFWSKWYQYNHCVRVDCNCRGAEVCVGGGVFPQSLSWTATGSVCYLSLTLTSFHYRGLRTNQCFFLILHIIFCGHQIYSTWERASRD